MTVQLMLTCLCDAFYGEVGIAAVKVLRAVGCEVVFPEGQTCCGQPPFNAGDWESARGIGEHAISQFDPSVPIVTPSGSCAAMIRDGYPLLWPDRNPLPCFEVGEFLVKHLGITQIGRDENPPSPQKVAFHRACHGRALGLTDEQELLVKNGPGVEIVAFDQAEQCCGFGGAFASTHGRLSSGIGKEKLSNVIASGAQILLSGDMGCLMHLKGLIDRERMPLATSHYLVFLAERL